MATKRVQRSSAIWIAVCVLCLAVIALVLVTQMGNGGRKPPAQSTTDESATSLLPADGRLISGYFYDEAIAFSFPDIDSGKMLSYVYTANRWHWAEDADFPVNDAMLYAMSYAVTNLTATRALSTDELSLADAGLTDPVCRVSITYHDETTYTVLYGAANAVTGSRYAMIEGQDVIFLVPGNSNEYFSYTFLETGSADLLPDFSTYKLERVTTSDASGNPIVEEAQGSTCFVALEQLALQGVLEYKPSEEKLLSYGLDLATRESVTIDYLQFTNVTGSDNSTNFDITVPHTMTIHFGKPMTGAESYCYFAIEGVDMVYVVSADLANDILMKE